MYALEYGFGRDANDSSIASGFCEGDGNHLAHEDCYRRKYRHWRGRSGRSYVFSVYTPRDCPAYEDAVLIVAARSRAKALVCIDMGRCPEARMSELRQRFGDALDEVEFQVHLLADRDGDRRSLIEDISRAPFDT